MSRFDHMISGLKQGERALGDLIHDLQKDQNLQIIYDIFIEHQKDFEDKIKSPEEFKTLVKETLAQTIRKLYNIENDEFKHLLIGKTVKLYKDSKGECYKVLDVYGPPTKVEVKLQSLQNGGKKYVPLEFFLNEYSRTS